VAPWATNSAAWAGERFHTLTRWSACSSSAASFLPMVPIPITVVFMPIPFVQ